MLVCIRRVRNRGSLNDENMKKIYYITTTLSFVAIFSFIVFFLFFFAISSSPVFFSPLYEYMCSCQDMTAGRF